MALERLPGRICIPSVALSLAFYGTFAYSGVKNKVNGIWINLFAINYHCDVINSNSSDTDPGEDGFVTRRHSSDAVQAQPSLFSTEDVIIPSTIKSMRKAVSAIHATPFKAEHNHTLHTRRLFDACILVAQLDFRKRDRQQVERMRAERVSPIFEVRITNLARLAEIPGKNYQRLREDLDRVYEMDLKWNMLGEGGKLEWSMKSHFLASLGIGEFDKAGLIRFTIDPSILEIVLEPRHWAVLSLQAMASLGTAASYALFQNCWRYIGTQAKVTAALPTETWIMLLLGHTRYVKEDPKTKKLTIQYGEFKRRCLTDAIARVNDVQALSYTLELKEILSGNRVSKLQFRFIPKKQESLGLPLTWPADGLQVLEQLGFSELEIGDMSQAHSYEEVAESIVRLKTSVARTRAAGKPITSRKAYFLGILSNVADGASDDELEHEKIEAEVQLREAERHAKERQDRAKEGFAKHQGGVFAVRLFELDSEFRASLFADFEASAEGQKHKLLLEKGWSPKNVGALSVFKAWLAEAHADTHGLLLCNPEDKSLEAWMAWRLDSLQNSDH